MWLNSSPVKNPPQVLNLLTPECFLLPNSFLCKISRLLKVERPENFDSQGHSWIDCIIAVIRIAGISSYLVETLGVCSLGLSSPLPRSYILSSPSFSLIFSPDFVLSSSPGVTFMSSPTPPSPNFSSLPCPGLLVQRWREQAVFDTSVGWLGL